MIYCHPFRIVSGAAADDPEIRMGCQMLPAFGYPAGRAKLLGISVRGEDRRMPDVPPTGGDADFNIQMVITRGTTGNPITYPNVQATTVFYTDHPVMDRAGVRLFDAPSRRVFTQAATGTVLGAEPYLFAISFPARRGFAKRWQRNRAFTIAGINEILVFAFANAKALFGNGLALRGTLEWESTR